MLEREPFQVREDAEARHATGVQVALDVFVLVRPQINSCELSFLDQPACVLIEWKWAITTDNERRALSGHTLIDKDR